MAARDRTKTHRNLGRPPFACVALLLQGGGALGAYQAGVYQALAEADILPDWIAGISIGAINAALIAGNAPKDRLDRLRQFWERITAGSLLSGLGAFELLLPKGGDDARNLFNQASAGLAMLAGAPAFFVPRFPGPWLAAPGSVEATSFYDTSLLKSTLEELIDFDRINQEKNRFSVGAVNVRTGNFVYFDSATHTIGPEHVMASGALPPGFPAVEIDGESYWDGGMVSNTPLQWVFENSHEDTLAFQVDLWSARGDYPRNLSEVAVRQKEIQFSSRTRASTDSIKHMQDLRAALATLLKALPPELKHLPEVKVLGEAEAANHMLYNIVQLIYRSKHYEGNSKDYDFSRLAMEEHWRSGYQDAVRTLHYPEIRQRPKGAAGVNTFDLTQDPRE